MDIDKAGSDYAHNRVGELMGTSVGMPIDDLVFKVIRKAFIDGYNQAHKDATEFAKKPVDQVIRETEQA